MRPMIIAASLALLLTACADDPGVTTGNVHCETGRSVEEAVFDYGEDAVGYETIGEAIEAFRVEEAIWQLRDDWHVLTQGDTSSSPVEFTDDRGWIYLSVDLVERNGGWLVAGYMSCAPPGS